MSHFQSIRLLGLGAAIGAVTFAVLIFVAGALFPGYSHIDQMISELGGPEANHPWVQNANFVLFGLSVVGLAVALMLDSGGVFVAAVLVASLGFFGTAMEGVVHCDPGCLGKTDEGMVHLMSGLVGFVSGVVGVLLLGRRWRRDPRWQGHARLTLWCGWLSLAGLLTFIGTGAVEATSIDGLAQRLFAIPLIVWAFGTGLRLYRMPVSTRAAESAPPPGNSQPAGVAGG